MVCGEGGRERKEKGGRGRGRRRERGGTEEGEGRAGEGKEKGGRERKEKGERREREGERRERGGRGRERKEKKRRGESLSWLFYFHLSPFFFIRLLHTHHTGQFSPVMSSKRAVANENGCVYPFVSQMSTSSLLEVPSISRANRSTSSTPSPSTSPPTSPSLTPSSPRSPNDVYRYDYPQPQMNRCEYTQPHINTTYESTDEEWVDGDGIGKDIHILSEDVDESQGYSSYSSKESSTNDISDVTRLEVNSPRGLRPLPQIVLAQSLPDLLLPQGRKSTDSSDGSPTNLVNG